MAVRRQDPVRALHQQASAPGWSPALVIRNSGSLSPGLVSPRAADPETTPRTGCGRSAAHPRWSAHRSARQRPHARHRTSAVAVLRIPFWRDWSSICASYTADLSAIASTICQDRLRMPSERLAVARPPGMCPQPDRRRTVFSRSPIGLAIPRAQLISPSALPSAPPAPGSPPGRPAPARLGAGSVTTTSDPPAPAAPASPHRSGRSCAHSA